MHASARGLLVVVAACGGSAAQPDLCPPGTPQILYPSVTVVEGRSMTFLLEAEDGNPMRPSGGLLDTNDHEIALVSPLKFSWYPDYPAVMTLEGVDDDIVEPTPRMTYFDSLVADCGTDRGGTVTVIDDDSQQIALSTWALAMGTSSTATFDVELTLPPQAPVTITLAPTADPASHMTLVDVTPTQIVLGPTDYNVPQTITITSTVATTTDVEVYPDPTSNIPPQAVHVTVTN